VKIPPSTTTGAAANARLHRAETTAAGVERLATPGEETTGSGAGALPVDSFEKSAPSPFGALLGERRTIWPGGIEPTLQATPESVDTSSAAPPTATGEHERATIPQEFDRSGNPIARTSAPVDFATALAEHQDQLAEMMSSLASHIVAMLSGAYTLGDCTGLTDSINAGFQNLIATAQRQFDSLEGMASTAEERAELSKMAESFLEEVHNQWHDVLKQVAHLSKELETR
jgi:hypothetical protein